MATTTKSTITNVQMMTEAITALKAVNAPTEVIEKAERHLAVLSKPRNGSPSVKRLENERLAHEIFKILPNEPVSNKWIQEHAKGVMTSQKAVAISKVAQELNLWQRVQIGKKIMYQKMN